MGLGLVIRTAGAMRTVSVVRQSSRPRQWP